MQQQNIDLATQYAAGTGKSVQLFEPSQFGRLLDDLIQTDSVVPAGSSGGLTGAMDTSQAHKSKRRMSVVRFSPNVVENIIIEEPGARIRAEGGVTGGPSIRNAASGGSSVQQQNTGNGHVAAGVKSATLHAKQQQSQQCAASESHNSVTSAGAQDCMAHEGTKQLPGDNQAEPQKQPVRSAGTVESKATLKVPNSGPSNKNSGGKAVHAANAGAASQKETRSVAQSEVPEWTPELKRIAPKYMTTITTGMDPQLVDHLRRRRKKGFTFKPSSDQ